MDRVEELGADMARAGMAQKEKRKWLVKAAGRLKPKLVSGQTSLTNIRSETVKERYDRLCREQAEYDLQKYEERRARRGQ